MTHYVKILILLKDEEVSFGILLCSSIAKSKAYGCPILELPQNGLAKIDHDFCINLFSIFSSKLTLRNMCSAKGQMPIQI